MKPADLARPEIRALEPYASARSVADAAGILLNANESPWPAAGDKDRGLNRYPHPQPPELIRRLAECYGVAEQQVLATRGSDEGIDLLVRAFCRAGRDGVVVCPPCFGMYAVSARIQGAEVTEVPLVDAGRRFTLDTKALAAAPPARITFLCSPNNPTGNPIPAASVTALADKVAGHGLVVLDEAYVEFSRQRSLAAAVADHPNLVVLRTLSKAHALAGCRLGAIIADPAVLNVLRRILPPYPLPTPAVEAALEALGPESLTELARRVKRLTAERERLHASLAAHGSIRRVWESDANFLLLRAADGPGLVTAAADAGIRLRDVSGQPGLADCVRITVGLPEENDVLLEFLREWLP